MVWIVNTSMCPRQRAIVVVIIQQTDRHTHLYLEQWWTWMVDQLQKHSLHRHDTRCQCLTPVDRQKVSKLVQVLCWFCSMMTRCISQHSSQWLVNRRRILEHSTSTCTECFSRHSTSSPMVDLATLHSHRRYVIVRKHRHRLFWFFLIQKSLH